MINSFGLKCPSKIIFGFGELSRLQQLAEEYGSSPLLMTGRRTLQRDSQVRKLLSCLTKKFPHIVTTTIGNEPTPADIDTIISEQRRGKIDLIIAIGGGSVIDSGKAVAAMFREDGSVAEYMEGVGRRKPNGIKLPFIAIPTTAGTGSEATTNAVLSNIGPSGYKKSLRHDNYIPDLALIDPELAMSCPSALSLACGMDCFSQLVEGYLSTGASQLTDLLALDGLRAVSRSLKLVGTENPSPAVRSDMAYAALLSGIVLTNAGLGTIHGFASAAGGVVDIPHGLVCGMLMASTNRKTLEKLRNSPASEQTTNALQKYATLGEIFSQRECQTAEWYQDSFIEELNNLTALLGHVRLSDYGINKQSIPAIVGQTGNKNNPVKLSSEELTAILEEVL